MGEDEAESSHIQHLIGLPLDEATEGDDSAQVAAVVAHITPWSERWRLGIRAGETAVVLGFWGGGLAAASDLVIAAILLGAGLLVGVVAVMTDPARSRTARTLITIVLIAVFSGSEAVVVWRHQTDASQPKAPAAVGAAAEKPAPQPLAEIQHQGAGPLEAPASIARPARSGPPTKKQAIDPAALPARVVVTEIKYTPAADNSGRHIILVANNKGPGVAYSGAVETRARPSQVAFSDSEIAIHQDAVLDRARVAFTKKNSIEAGDPVTYIISQHPIAEEVWTHIAKGDLRFYIFAAFPYIDNSIKTNDVKIATYAGYYTSDSNGGVMFQVLSNLTDTYTIRPGGASRLPSPLSTESEKPR